MTTKTIFNPLLGAGFQSVSTTAEGFAAAQREPTGFEDPDNIVTTYSHGDRTITLTHSGGTIAWWYRGLRHTVASGWVSAPHDDTPGEWFLKFTGDITTENWALAPWTFDQVTVSFVEYATLAADSYALRETHGLMQWQSHHGQHVNIGTYRTRGLILTTSTFSINGTTDAQNTWGLDEGDIQDEDIATTIAAWPQDSYTLLRRDGANGTWLFTKGATLPFFQAANTLQYNQNTGSTWQLTNVTEDNFVNYYVYAVPTTADADSQSHRVWVIPGQAIYTSIAAAQQEFPANLDLGTLATLSPEFVAVVRVTMRYNASGAGSLSTTGRCNIAAQFNITGSRAVQVASAGFSPANHGSLSGLADTGSHPATAISADATGFDKNLAGTDINLQLVATAFDEFNSLPSDATNASASPDLHNKVAFASATDGQSATFTFDARGAIEFLLDVNTDGGLIVGCDYKSTAINALSDPSTLFLATDAGTGIFVSKSANSAAVTVKNRMGGTKTIGVLAVRSSITATAWS